MTDGVDPTQVQPSPEDEESATHQLNPTEVYHGGAEPELPEIPEVQLTRVIGQGGMGVVYHGTQSYLDREVAVKLLSTACSDDKSFAARFQREAKILAGMTHPNIVGCFQAGTNRDGYNYLVMEFIDGPDLSQWVRREGPLEVNHALRLTRDMAAALEHAHEAGIIHRDVKPGNVLLQAKDTTRVDATFPFVVKLADLGLARTETRGPADTQITMAGAIIGTPATMSPEQFDDPDNVDFRTDIYGLGCVLYFALTGAQAFPQAGLATTIARKQAAQAPNPRDIKPEIPEEVGALVADMLHRDKEQRPASYPDLMARCSDLLGETVTLPPTQPGGLRYAFVAIALLVVLGTGWLIYDQFINKPPEVAIQAPAVADEGEEITLAAVATDPDGDDLEYAWQQLQMGQEPVVSIDSTAATVKIVAPQHGTGYELKVEVCVKDPEGLEVRATHTVSIRADDDHPEIVGLEPQVNAREGEEVRLDASATRDPENEVIRWLWAQDIRADEPRVALPDANKPTLSFVPPQAKESYELHLRLTAHTDNPEPDDEHRILVRVEANDERPAVQIQGPSGCVEGEKVRLTVNAIDPEGEDVTIRWKQISGPTVLLETTNEETLEFTAPYCKTPAEITIQVEAFDGTRTTNKTWGMPIRFNQEVDVLQPNESVELFDEGPSPLAKRLHRWANVPKTNWGDGEHPGVIGRCGKLDNTQIDYVLPRGQWFLRGQLEPLEGHNRPPPDEAGIRVQVSQALSYSIALVRSGKHHFAQVDRWERTPGSSEWRREKTLGTSSGAMGEKSPLVWDRDRPLFFFVDWEAGKLVMKCGNRDYMLVEVECPLDAEKDRPFLLTAYIRAGMACFCGFHLSGNPN